MQSLPRSSGAYLISAHTNKEQKLKFHVTMNSQWVVPWLRYLVASLSLCRPQFETRPVHVGLELDKVTLEHVFLRVLQLSPVSLIPVLHIHTSFIYQQCYIISATDSMIQ